MAYSTITKPSDYFNTVLYTGNGGTKNVTGVGFQPDWVWMKVYDGTSSHALFDVIRGVQKRLVTNDNQAQLTQSGLTSFDADGFTLGSQGAINGNGGNHVAWNWKAGGAGSANTDGYLSSTVSVNQTAGFSIVTYTGDTVSGRTIGHGLNAVPKMIIVKGTGSNSSPDNWCIYHEGIGNTKRLKFNSTDAPGTGSGYWNNTSPTSSVFTIGNSSEPNSSNGVYIAYCFAEKKGYSKFGSYKGNGNADGTFVYTGFKPALVIRKRTDTTADWRIDDNKRPGYNVIPHTLFPNGNNSETSSTHYETDFLSNGFKCYGTSGNQNASGGTYIYMAFAEEPLVANVGASIPATAR